MRATVLRHSANGAARCVDTAGCRTITLSNPSALNAMTTPMVQDLYNLYVTAPHPNPTALYLLRGDGRRSFCAGGDLKALVGPNRATNNPLFYVTEYRLNAHIATMSQTQVAMWAGHVLGSGVGVSVHGRYRVACETTRFAMPETQIGAANDVGSSSVFASLPVPGLGAYMAITGNPLKGADVFHAGLATHYIPLEKFDAVEAALAALPSGGENAVADCLASFSENTEVPPFTLREHEPVIARAFGTLTETTTVSDIMERLRAEDSAFAADTLALMERICPFAMCVVLENMKRQGTPVCRSALDSLRGDYALIQSPELMRDFTIGVEAVLVTKNKNPQWTHKSVKEVDMAEVRRQFTLPPGVQSF